MKTKQHNQVKAEIERLLHEAHVSSWETLADDLYKLFTKFRNRSAIIEKRQSL
jgi:hypothetical protein